MHVLPLRLEAEVTDAAGSRVEVSDLEGTGRAFGLGPVEVTMELHDTGIEWSVANRGDATVSIRSVALVYAVAGARGPVRMFRNGYQSWSPSTVGVLGVDVDPSVRAGFPFLQAVHHADQRRARPGELRSEWVAVLADGWGADDAAVLLGFEGGSDHDGTFRLGPGGDGIEVRVEAYLGDAELGPGGKRSLHPVMIADGPAVGASVMLEQWADRAGKVGGARVGAPFQIGWCSWYQYFHDVSETDIAANLALADRWPFEVFQVDDGYQRAIGDWLETGDRFPSDLAGLAASISAAGRTPGLWLAPFLVAPDSAVARRHPDWIARHLVDGVDTGPLRTWWNPAWGGGEDGFMYGLDTTHPEVVAHLESVATAVVDAGFPYLKLDFTFSPSVDGGYHDPTLTPAERVRAGFAAIRRGAGDDAFLLGCGVPLANVVGLVDANRIGPDVAPVWSLDPADEMVAGYLGIQPATAHAFTNTLTRSFMHRRLWVNDPDCVMLRTEDTGLTQAAARTWAHAVGVSGGMALVSDDLSSLGPDAHALFDEVVALGRHADADARDGGGARCPDLLEHPAPGRLGSAAGDLDADPLTGASHLTTASPG
ncbi:MAG TPA: glycoside hydrolase family 36 protein [Acidimicrobiales bacterium]